MVAGPQGPTIVSVRWRPFRLPMKHRFETAHGTLEDREGVLLELRASDGASGTGEASPLPSLGAGCVADVVRLLREHASGLAGGRERDALSVLPASGPGAAALRCAVDTALVDMAARRRGVPAAGLLTKAPAGSVEVNAVIGGGAPSEVADLGREASDAGYRALKLKAGTGTLEDDVRRVAALRAACPDASLRLDANGAWDEGGAVRAFEALAPFDVELLEQPVPAADVDALARLREHSPFPLAADEALSIEGAVERILASRAAAILVLKPALLGGIRPALALARRAAAYGIESFATTTFDSSVGIAAAAHLAAALPWGRAHGLATGEHLADDLVTAPLLPSGGRLAVPGPGLGVTVDERALDRLAVDRWHEATA